MSTIEQSIEVQVPVSTAYNQWTQFETFPEFMEGVDRVQQLDDTTTHWVTGDLERFKAFIESQGSETGSWRGDVR